jgi:hypothetical protein
MATRSSYGREEIVVVGALIAARLNVEATALATKMVMARERIVGHASDDANFRFQQD